MAFVLLVLGFWCIATTITCLILTVWLKRLSANVVHLDRSLRHHLLGVPVRLGRSAGRAAARSAEAGGPRGPVDPTQN